MSRLLLKNLKAISLKQLRLRRILELKVFWDRLILIWDDYIKQKIDSRNLRRAYPRLSRYLSNVGQRDILNTQRRNWHLLNSRFLFKDLPPRYQPIPLQFSDHWPVAWVPEFGVDIVTHEIEKRGELGITDTLCVGFVSFGETVQVCKDLFRGGLFDGSITEFLDKPYDDSLAVSYSIVFTKL